jgi:uncharacterized protein YbjT (DUF2867 family)
MDAQRQVGVIGAGGQTGTEIVRAVATRGGRAVALVRSDGAAQAARASGAAEVRRCDLTDPPSLASAFRGLDAVALVPPVFDPDEARLVANARDAAQAAGVSRLVLHSVLHPYTPTMPHHRRKADAEAELRASSLAWTILQPSMYAQTTVMYLRLSPPGELTVPFDPDRPFNVVDLHDIAEIAARTLLEPGTEHGCYEIAGPAILTARAMGAQLAEALGRPLVPRRVRPWELPLPPKITDKMSSMVAMCEEYDRHGLVGNGAVSRLLLGREPTAFAAVAQRMAPTLR